ncbi:hypothetical protein [Bacillus xiapuensis]|uniref:hypothetical protein n=1 Tax=Bacillus xiapuensis TaxID=2014075 RepID=UPI000C248BB9|nr:hypothetical protein [Bacillus xiapuensis]
MGRGTAMHLAYGITGFYEAGDQPLPRNAGKLFKKMCWEAARTIGADVLMFQKPGHRTNFFHVLLDNGRKRIHILLNAHYPLIAFAASVEFGHITFYDEPALSESFKGFYLCEAKELNQLLRIQSHPEFALLHHHDLNKAELSQIMYWKPNTVGEVVFNFWD